MTQMGFGSALNSAGVSSPSVLTSSASYQSSWFSIRHRSSNPLCAFIRAGQIDRELLVASMLVDASDSSMTCVISSVRLGFFVHHFWYVSFMLIAANIKLHFTHIRFFSVSVDTAGF